MSSVCKRFGPLGLLLGTLALSGCGFHPLYGNSGSGGPGVTALMDQIEIPIQPNREGQLLHQALERDLQRDGAPGYYRYHLAVSYSTNSQAIGIQPDTSSSRTRFLSSATWSLSPIGAPGLIVAKGTAHAMDAENIIDNQYFATSLENGVMNHQLSREIARQITTQIAIFFRTHPSARS